MVEPDNPDLSITAQCRLLSISRSGYYYAPVPENDATLALMAVIDQVFMDCPWYGSRQMARHLQRMGHAVGRRRVRRLMARMGLAAIYQRPRTSDPHPEHRIYPYLLRDLAIIRPNQIWCADVTYLSMRRGFLYLVAIMDWATRKVLAWRISNTMDAGFCVEALQDAMGGATASRTSSIRIRAVNSPVTLSPACCARPKRGSAWMAGAVGWTTSSLNACGDP